MKNMIGSILLRCTAVFLAITILLCFSACDDTGTQVETVKKEPISLLEGETAFYISPDGNDSNDGSFEKPFETFAAAQKAVRTANDNMQGNIYVVFREGVYTESISLYNADSGENGFDVVLMSYPEEKAEIYGGQQVVGFKQVSGKPYYKVRLDGFSSVRQFYVDGKFQPRATSVTRLLPQDWLNGDVERDGFLIKTEDLEGITNTNGLELRLSYEWQDIIVPVKGVRKANSETSCIYMSDGAQHIYSVMTNISGSELTSGLELEFFLENSVDLIDEPGEWAFDTVEHELYYYPQDGVDMKTASFEIPVKEQLMSIMGLDGKNKAHNITVDGLDFRMAAWDYVTENGFLSWQADAYWEEVTIYPSVTYNQIKGNVSVENVSNITFKNNTFTNLGGTALTAVSGADNIEISQNAFANCAAGAVTVGNHKQASSTPDAEVNALCNNILINDNAVYNIGESYYSVVGLMVYFGSNISITHNDIMYTPNSAISVGWGSWNGKYNSVSHTNKITGNRIMYHSQKSRDSGGIYTLDNQPDSVLENNYIKDNGFNAKGIYHDQGSGCYTDSYNVLDMKNSGFWTNDWSPNTHDITYVNNYSSILRYTQRGTNITHTGDNYITDRNWPLEARNVILSSGVVSGTVRARALGLDSGLKLWLSADSKVTTDEARAVSRWNNLAASDSSAQASGSPEWSGYVSNENHAIRFGANSYLSVENSADVDAFTLAFVCNTAHETDYKELLAFSGLDVSKSAAAKATSVAGKTDGYIYVCADGKGTLYKNGKSVYVWESNPPSLKPKAEVGKGEFALFELMVYSGKAAVNVISEYFADRYYIDIPTQENLVLWLDAARLVTADKNGSVTKWGDISSRRIGGLIQMNTDIAPTYKDKAINGLPAVCFDGQGDFMYNYSTRWTGEEFTMFVVMKPEKTEIQSFGALGGIGQFLVEIKADGSVSMGSNYPNRVSTASGVITHGKPQLLVMGREPVFKDILPTDKVWESELPGIMRLYSGDTLIGEFDSRARKNTIEWGGLMLGNSEGNTLNGLVAEILVYDRVLNQNEHKSVTDYLNEKYAID